MQTNLIPVSLIVAMLASPAVACTDWKAIAAFDAVIAARDAAWLAANDAVTKGMVFHNPPTDPELAIFKRTEAARKMDDAHYADTINDKAAAIADKCQEDAR